jgi:hypothetical protein
MPTGRYASFSGVKTPVVSNYGASKKETQRSAGSDHQNLDDPQVSNRYTSFTEVKPQVRVPARALLYQRYNF